MTVTPGTLFPASPHPHRCKPLPRHPQYGCARRVDRSSPFCAALPPQSHCSAAAYLSTPETAAAASSNTFSQICRSPDTMPGLYPTAAAGRNFSAPLLQPHLPGHRLQTLLHFAYLPLCQMSPLQSKRDICCLEYYLMETVRGQNVGRFDAYDFSRLSETKNSASRQNCLKSGVHSLYGHMLYCTVKFSNTPSCSSEAARGSAPVSPFRSGREPGFPPAYSRC